eukprot:TRINITY_DN3057_c0_g1_i1.p1 TRINITY_DN3057_c0_g1~~TRINITY_DN3057_c0_g1_i1.p1  ORF type:complete len:875 (-),score=246.30 TRINITY_DN3057_c0_g1_i1:43-2667(-)
MMHPSDGDRPKANSTDSDPNSTLLLCRNFNGQVLGMLNELNSGKEGESRSQPSNRIDVGEFIKLTERINSILQRCISNGAQGADPEKCHSLMNQIWDFRRKIIQLQKKGALPRFVTQARLRPKIEQLCNNICFAAENLEKEIREKMVDKMVNGMQDELKDILDLIDPDGKSQPAGTQAPRTRDAISDSMAHIQDSETRKIIDNQLSIVSDPKRRQDMMMTVPEYKIRPISKTEICSTFSGFYNDEEEKMEGDVTWARSVSTYPNISESGVRQGDPICDMYAITHFENGTIAAVSDGCGWGTESKEASRKASQMFLHYMKRHHEEIDTLRTAAGIMLKCLNACHKAIIAGRSMEEIESSTGTTTMIAVIVFELMTPIDGYPFAFVSVSIGDCKGYVYDAKTGRMEEFSTGNRGNQDMRDPGGRIGPQLGNGQPDLRNLQIYHRLCHDGDLVALFSDGVHDNLGPKVNGLRPKELGLTADDWKNVTLQSDEMAMQKWSEDLINSILSKAEPVTVSSVAKPFVQHAVNLTAKMRNFMETRPKERLPDDYAIMPGKVDHTTALSFKIGIKKKMWMPAVLDSNNLSLSPVKSPMSPTQQKANVVRRTMSTEGEDAHAAIWDRCFDTYVKKWSDFIQGLNLKLSEEEEQKLRTIIDYSKTGSVTRYKFTEFLKGFGPLEKCVENVRRVVSADWFHGFISLNEAKKFLEHQPAGTYLIRFSGSRPGSFVLDYVIEAGHVRSVRLSAHLGGGFAAPSTNQGVELVFKSLHELVETYSRMGVLTKPFSSDITNKPWFCGDMTGEEAETVLAGQPAGTFLIRFSAQPGSLAASFVQPSGQVAKGQIRNGPLGYQVNQKGMYFQTLDELVAHYQKQKIFTQPYER